ncbi:MAG: hypothetical protein M3Q56_00510 [Bacteroidota bacterium]|nr:hypothetical protein [Bacteroidota bacterium]
MQIQYLKHWILSSCSVFISFLPCCSQKYITSIGFRLGTEAGVSIQQRLAKHITAEGILLKSFKTNDNVLILLAEDHNSIITRRLNIYFGVGPHWYFHRDSFNVLPSGFSLLGGVEFTIGRANLSWDILPAFNFVGAERIFDYKTAISIRYVLLKEKKKKWNWKWKK